MMNINMTLSQPADFAMPISGNGLVAAVRALPTGVSSAAADRKRFSIDTTRVCGYSHVTDVAVLKGTFPGTSAWSPPI